MNAQETKALLLQVTKQAYADKMFAATSGNLSIFDRETGRMYITPSSYPYDIMTTEDVMVIDLDGNIIDGPHKPSSEWPMHTLIYKTYPRVCAVVHCHSIYATAAAAAGQEIPLFNHELCMYCSSPVRVMPFEVPGSDALGESAIRGFGEDNCVTLLQNHGPIAMGASMWHAFDAACAVEQAAHALFITKAYGQLQLIPEEGRAALRRCDPLQKPDTGKVEIVAV